MGVAIVDRRRFLVGSAWAGLAAGLGALATGCGPVETPHSTLTPAPTATDAPPSFSTLAPSTPTPAPSRPPGPRSTRIADENALRGTRAWDLRSGLPLGPTGFLSHASAAPGERVAVHVAGSTRVDVSWYRLGWYDGDGGRLVRADRGVPATASSPPTRDARTGLAEAGWPAALEIEIPPDWPSGMYLAVFTAASGGIGCAPLVVRPSPGPPAPVLFVSASTTWQAYNNWGGADFYADSPADPAGIARGRRAVQVGFDRPLTLASGAGYLPRWELQFVRWQEREGRDVEYAADVDLELHPEVLAGRRLVVFAGHHEYWSRPMRTALEGAIASGVNVAFLSANEVYWQVRFEPSPLGPARRVTCYKVADLDPLASTRPELTTVRWREAPVNDPEATLVGQMYGHIVRRPADWIVQQHRHWLYEGTGLRTGDRIVNLVGQEYDTFFPQFAQPGTAILAQGPVDTVIRRPRVGAPSSGPGIHTSTMYTAVSGATVFAAGTFQWSWAIDKFGSRAYLGHATPYDERVVRMTRNLFDRLGDGPAPPVPGRPVRVPRGHA
ncbi:MAG TPA: N,N-dimethylformamidase beta subunit family domain-containing protein [Candidatus Limnocylindrales bacterium]